MAMNREAAKRKEAIAELKGKLEKKQIEEDKLKQENITLRQCCQMISIKAYSTYIFH